MILLSLLLKGYQHQLKYRHEDGSYSAFGPNSNDKETGGTWLTAFVLRCFADSYAFDYIKIDKNDISKSLDELLKRQDEDGSFRQTGAQLYSKALSGGLKDKKTALSAYVMISMLKSKIALNITLNQKINKGLTYLKLSLENIELTDTYTLALSLYAFKIDSFDLKIIKKVENELDKRAIDKSKNI